MINTNKTIDKQILSFTISKFFKCEKYSKIMGKRRSISCLPSMKMFIVHILLLVAVVANSGKKNVFYPTSGLII